MKLELRALEKTYATRQGVTPALLPTSFTVESGEFVSLIGPSGCGKSTTLYLVAGLEPATGGEILLGGRPVTKPGRDRGMVFQNYTLFPWLTVRQNVRFSLGLARNRRPDPYSREAVHDSERADSLLELLGLADFGDAYPRELSGGMKQRVAIVRALVNRPQLLLMDEPFGALDAQTREELQEMMLLLQEHERTTILFVTHDIDEALFLSSRILVFSPRPGRIVQDLAVPFGVGRELDLKLSPEFLRLKRELFGLLHHHHAPARDRDALLRRLVHAHDRRSSAPPAISHP
ncbi:MAG TPA: ABC transporter ATP-binding protein [Opitutaceae bacterium]|nr:ABC transporter ATP-binding protein [Opitutaceae bacterium]